MLAGKVTKLVQCSNGMTEELDNSPIRKEHLERTLEKNDSLSAKEKFPTECNRHKIVISEQGIEYLGGEEENITKDFKTSVPPWCKKIPAEPKGRKKKKVLLSIFLVVVFTISSLFAYYLSSQDQPPPEAMISQNIKIPIPQKSAQDISATHPQTAIMQQEWKPSEPSNTLSQKQ